jgi:uncharacterized protein (TIGR02001 family)
MFKKALATAAMIASLGLPTAAFAQTAAPDAKPAEPKSPHTFTGNVGLFSQYVFRGLTQTNRKPAIQGGFDYAHESGLYAGVWGSNISWITDSYGVGGSYSAEFDTYAGYKWALPKDFGIDVGFLRYNYPGRQPVAGFPAGFAKAETNELYVAGSWKWVSLKYSYSLGKTFGIQDASGSSYIDLTAAYPIADTGYTLTGHIGRQMFEGTNAPLWVGTGCGQSCLDYTDYKIGLNKEWWGFNFGLMWTKANTRGLTPSGATVWNNNYGRNIGDSTITVSVQKTF